MSKLSASLKALIAAPYARPNTTPASPRVRQVYEAIKKEATSKNVGVPAWLSLSVCFLPLANSMAANSVDVCEDGVANRS